MTCIAAQRLPGGAIVVGADRAVSDATGHVYCQATPKIWRVGDAVIGVSGSADACTAIEHGINLAAPLPSTPALRWVVNAFVSAMQEALSVAGAAYDPEHEDTNFDVLIALRGRIFLVGARGCVVEVERTYAAIGSGAGYALGAFAAGARLSGALEAAALHDANVRPGANGFDELECSERA